METKNCIHCGREFAKRVNISRKNWEKSKFCSRGCMYNFKRITKTCELCGKEFTRMRCYSQKKVRFCSQLCCNRSRPDRGGMIKRICKYCKKEFLVIRHNVKRGRGIYCSAECQILDKRGANHWNWKGGITPKDSRQGVEGYKEWRMKVYQRDHFTCWICEEKQKHPVAHHLLSWERYPELRFNMGNGLTLCRFCHKVYAHNKNNW